MSAGWNGALLLTIWSNQPKLKKTFTEGPTPSLSLATIMSYRKFPPPPNTPSLSSL